MRHTLLAAAMLCLLGTAHAKEYGKYDLNKIVTVSKSADGKEVNTLNPRYLDLILSDLASHVTTLPPVFDSVADQDRATDDVNSLITLLDRPASIKGTDPNILLRAAFVNSMGNTLAIPGTFKKADKYFKLLLAAIPNHPQGNYLYGKLLAGSEKPLEALPYLEKALATGLTDAEYGIGMVYLASGDTKNALARLTHYKTTTPDDPNIDKLLEDIRTGKIDTTQATDKPDTKSATNTAIKPKSSTKGTKKPAK